MWNTPTAWMSQVVSESGRVLEMDVWPGLGGAEAGSGEQEVAGAGGGAAT